MREIKFKAYYESEGKYIPLKVGDLTLLMEGGFIVNEEFPVKELCQFTGLHDKNGKEIYEGDVVLVPDLYSDTVDVGIGSVTVAQQPDNHLSEVKFSNGSFVFVIKENAEIISKGEYTWKELSEQIDEKEIEVIGDIYQNPELV